MGWARRTAPVEPANRAEPKEKMPPSRATSQYPGSAASPVPPAGTTVSLSVTDTGTTATTAPVNAESRLVAESTTTPGCTAASCAASSTAVTVRTCGCAQLDGVNRSSAGAADTCPSPAAVSTTSAPGAPVRTTETVSPAPPSATDVPAPVATTLTKLTENTPSLVSARLGSHGAPVSTQTRTLAAGAEVAGTVQV